MQTMQPVLLIGRYDWSEATLPLSACAARLDRATALMAARGWHGLLAYGTAAEQSALCWLSGMVPRLAPALVLIVPGEAPRLVTLDNPRMVAAAKAQSWIADVAAGPDAAKPVADWLANLPSAGKRPVIGIAGTALMTPRHHAAITGALVGKADTVAADEALAGLRASKDRHELALMGDAARLLDAAATVFAAAWRDGTGIAAAALAGERAARAAGAQDARFLFSPDGGATLADFDGGADARPAAAVAHFAVRHAGYWADGCVTLSPGSAATAAVQRALDAGIAALRPGVAAGTVATAIEQALAPWPPHPVTGPAFGSAIGLSLNEAPRIAADESAKLVEGTVLSLRVGVADPAAGHALLSALLVVADDGVTILWRSP